MSLMWWKGGGREECVDACGCGGPPTEPQLTIVALSRIAARNKWLNLVFPDDLLGP